MRLTRVQLFKRGRTTPARVPPTVRSRTGQGSRTGSVWVWSAPRFRCESRRARGESCMRLNTTTEAARFSIAPMMGGGDFGFISIGCKASCAAHVHVWIAQYRVASRYSAKASREASLDIANRRRCLDAGRAVWIEQLPPGGIRRRQHLLRRVERRQHEMQRCQSRLPRFKANTKYGTVPNSVLWVMMMEEGGSSHGHFEAGIG